MASITPKIRPVRSASRRCGRCSAAPLPTAAAKASVDMARERRAVAAKFIEHFQVGHGRRHDAWPDRAERNAYGLANLLAVRTTGPKSPSMLMRTLPGAEAGYSPK